MGAEAWRVLRVADKAFSCVCNARSGVCMLLGAVYMRLKHVLGVPKARLSGS